MHDSHPHTTSPPFRAARLLRGLFIAALAIAAAADVLLYAARVSERENLRQAAARRSSELSALKEGRSDETMIYDAETLAMIVDDPAAAERAASLVFSSVDFADERFARVGELANLKNVGVYSCRNADRLIDYLHGMASIERMWIEVSPLSDDGVRLLATLPRLKHIHFEQVMTSEEVRRLERALPRAVVDAPLRPGD